MSSSGDFGNPLRKFKLVFLGEQSGKSMTLNPPYLCRWIRRILQQINLLVCFSFHFSEIYVFSHLVTWTVLLLPCSRQRGYWFIDDFHVGFTCNSCQLLLIDFSVKHEPDLCDDKNFMQLFLLVSAHLGVGKREWIEIDIWPFISSLNHSKPHCSSLLCQLLSFIVLEKCLAIHWPELILSWAFYHWMQCLFY